MQDVDPKVLEFVQNTIVSGGKQWELLAAEMAAKAWAFVWVGTGVLTIGILSCVVGFIGGVKKQNNVEVCGWILGIVSLIVGSIMFGVNLNDAMAPMNAVLNNITK